MNMKIEQLEPSLVSILSEAHEAAYKASREYFNKILGGEDKFSCGFAWLSIYEFNGEKIKGNSKVGRMLKKAGIEQNYNRVFQIWNPSGFPCQNVDTLEHGAKAAAEVFRKYGFTAYAGSRLD